ncbi:hypothetical protein BUUB107078_28665 [Burkholderia ubonensis]|nr:hypothetical protein BUB20358_05879 [Burkholderia ubonensis]
MARRREKFTGDGATPGNVGKSERKSAVIRHAAGRGRDGRGRRHGPSPVPAQRAACG